jgi:hypothetical protein
MSDAVPAFRKSDSQGWLVLSNQIPGLGEESSLFMERMLALIDLSYPPLCLTLGSFSSAEADNFFDDYKTLTGVDVTIIDLWDLNCQETIEAVSQAGFVFFSGGLPMDWVTQIDPDGTGNTAVDFFHQDRMIMVVGPITASLGSWVYSPADGEIRPGLGWMPDAVVLPDEAAPMHYDDIREWLNEKQHAYAIGLPNDSIFALGPDGEIEVWSTTNPVIALGKGWSTV